MGELESNHLFVAILWRSWRFHHRRLLLEPALAEEVVNPLGLVDGATMTIRALGHPLFLLPVPEGQRPVAAVFGPSGVGVLGAEASDAANTELGFHRHVEGVLAEPGLQKDGTSDRPMIRLVLAAGESTFGLPSLRLLITSPLELVETEASSLPLV